jgi:hypothetical protein
VRIRLPTVRSIGLGDFGFMSADDKLQVVSAARFFDAIMNAANKKQEAQAAPRAQGLRIPLGPAMGKRIAPRRRSGIEECLPIN